jgi:hypothetical protein
MVEAEAEAEAVELEQAAVWGEQRAVDRLRLARGTC